MLSLIIVARTPKSSKALSVSWVEGSCSREIQPDDHHILIITMLMMIIIIY